VNRLSWIHYRDFGAILFVFFPPRQGFFTITPSRKSFVCWLGIIDAPRLHSHSVVVVGLIYQLVGMFNCLLFITEDPIDPVVIYGLCNDYPYVQYPDVLFPFCLWSPNLCTFWMTEKAPDTESTWSSWRESG